MKWRAAYFLLPLMAGCPAISAAQTYPAKSVRIVALHFPAVGIETPTLDAVADEGTPRQMVVLESLTRFTRWVNYLGLPALSVPCGFTPAGMPVGFQLIGRPFSEQRLFRIGHAYQQATEWHLAAPPAQ